MEKDEKKLEKQDIDNKKVDNKKNEKTETKRFQMIEEYSSFTDTGIS